MSTYMTRGWRLLKGLKNDGIDAGFAKHLRDLARPAQIAYARIMSKHNADPSGVEFHDHDGKERWAFVLPDVSGTGARIQFFDPRGFSGHECYPTLTEAVQEMVRQGYRTEDPGVLDKISTTPAWIEGMAWMDRVFRASSARAAA